MNIVYEKKGSSVTVCKYDNLSKKIVHDIRDNVDNIDEILMLENKYEYIDDKSKKINAQLKKLGKDAKDAKLNNFRAIMMGVACYVLMSFVPTLIPPIAAIILSIFATGTVIFSSNSIDKIKEYNDNKGHLEKQIAVLNDMGEHTYKKRLELGRTSIKVNTISNHPYNVKSVEEETNKEFDEIMSSKNKVNAYNNKHSHLSKTPLVDKYRKSKFVMRFKKHGISDEKIEKELKNIEKNISSQSQLSYEEAYKKFESEVNEIFDEIDSHKKLERKK